MYNNKNFKKKQPYPQNKNCRSFTYPKKKKENLQSKTTTYQQRIYLFAIRVPVHMYSISRCYERMVVISYIGVKGFALIYP